MRTKLSMFVRFSGIILVLVAIIAARDMFMNYSDSVNHGLKLLTPDESQVAGVATESPSDTEITEVKLISDSNMLSIMAEEAHTPEERMLGLMYRESLCSHCGMLFFNETDTREGFWMKNCEIPLDIIFISEEKKIVDIKHDFEPCTDEPCPVYHPDVPYRYVLEVNGGWTEKNDIEIGNVATF